MTKQRLHSNLAEIDLLTREELSQELSRRFDEAMRTRFSGLELQRFPVVSVTATGGTTQIFTTNDATPCGPEQGDIWMIRRIIVKSSVPTDTARFVVYRGSTPSDTQNAYTSRWLIEGFQPSILAPAPSQPAVPATGVAQQNVNTYPVQVVISPNGATITNVSVNGITVGTAAGTYTVPAFGSISIAYSVATPTWVWSNLNTTTAQGQVVNTGFYPGTKAIFLQPGEQIYAQVNFTTTNNQYSLDGEAIRCPAEMKGKLL